MRRVARREHLGNANAAQNARRYGTMPRKLQTLLLTEFGPARELGIQRAGLQQLSARGDSSSRLFLFTRRLFGFGRRRRPLWGQFVLARRRGSGRCSSTIRSSSSSSTVILGLFAGPATGTARSFVFRFAFVAIVAVVTIISIVAHTLFHHKVGPRRRGGGGGGSRCSSLIGSGGWIATTTTILAQSSTPRSHDEFNRFVV
mmetsp:Transcript_4429/g.12292  ORF Transcript_4429/g.12292 Transcript_4429/m.12292 type:complete len:201 (+) Transcript_4429:1254-1856(+)